jgi:hypothetical protein
MALITITSGDNLDIIYTIKDENDAVVDLTGGSIAWKALVSGPTTAQITKTGVLTDAANGITTVTLDPADTSSIKGTYTIDGEFTDSGSNVYTFDDGGLVIS